MQASQALLFKQDSFLFFLIYLNDFEVAKSLVTVIPSNLLK